MTIITANTPRILAAPDPDLCVPGQAVGCAGTANNPCGLEKELDITIPNLLPPSAQGYLNKIEVVWNTGTSYPDQIVNFIYRRLDNFSDYYDSPKIVPRDDGMIATLDTLDQYEFFRLWIRAETETHHGYWTVIDGITDPAWNSDSEIVYQGGDAVYHVNDVVLYDPT